MVIIEEVPGLEAENLSSIPNYITCSAYDLGQGAIRKCISQNLIYISAVTVSNLFLLVKMLCLDFLCSSVFFKKNV